MRKKLWIAALCLIVALALCACQKADPNQHLGPDKKPLQGFSGGQYYVDGYRQQGWLQLESGSYYLTEAGISTGWMDIEENRYFFDGAGLLQTGWLEDRGKTYLLDGNGVMQTGWQMRDGSLCYLGEDGAMVTGWQDIDGKRYCFDSRGVPLTGWLDEGGDRYYFTENGQSHTGWLEYEGDKYYFLPDGRMAKGEVQIEGRSWYFTSQGKNLLIVNFKNPVASDYAPTLTKWRTIQLETQTMAAVKAMILDGEAMGHKFWLNSAYRTVAQQQNIWNNRYNKYIAAGDTPEEAREKVSSSVATPGHSEHHTGLAVDIDGTWASLGWMAEHSWEYGLIVRYPEGKSDLTGVIYEPWHFRYVGKELAKELYELDMCIEEYMQMLTAQQESA